MLEIDGARFLIDPVFSERVSPIRHVGPRRMHPVPGSIADIPSIDAVLISHDHYDHLDQPSIVRLEETHRPHYVVPLGVNAHLLAWGVPEQRITVLDWRDETEVAGIRLTCTEARHNSGRGLVDSQTLWAGWALRGPRHSAYFPGDSGTSKRFAAIGADLGPFDLTLMPVGAYDPFWPDIHMDPEQALAAHRDVNRIGDEVHALTEDEAGVADEFIEERPPHRHPGGRPRGGRAHRDDAHGADRRPRVAPRPRPLGHLQPLDALVGRARPPHPPGCGRGTRPRRLPPGRRARRPLERRRPCRRGRPLRALVGAMRGARGPRLTGPPRRHTAYGRPSGTRAAAPSLDENDGSPHPRGRRTVRHDRQEKPVQLPILRRMGATTASQRQRATASPNYRDGEFRSHEPTHVVATSEAEGPGSMLATMAREFGHGRPRGTVPLVTPRHPHEPADLAVTWYGHATSVVELDGRRFLLDPVFGKRASPSVVAGPKRLHPVPGRIAEIPHLDAVVISHDHYDHLDEPSIRQLERTHQPHYVVPLGVDAHLRVVGRADGAHHEPRLARGDRDRGHPHHVHRGPALLRARLRAQPDALGGVVARTGPATRVFFGGDSGPTHRYADIGADLGPFDLTIIPIGAYSVHWPDIHLNPEEAIEAHLDVNKGETDAVLLPIHWATFNLATHWWSEPIRWARRAAAERGRADGRTARRHADRAERQRHRRGRRRPPGPVVGGVRRARRPGLSRQAGRPTAVSGRRAGCRARRRSRMPGRGGPSVR